jgi:hypothetical protein
VIVQYKVLGQPETIVAQRDGEADAVGTHVKLGEGSATENYIVDHVVVRPQRSDSTAVVWLAVSR